MPRFRFLAVALAAIPLVPAVADAQAAEAGSAQPGDPFPSAVFGTSIDVSGARLLVGARGHSGVDISAGAAYVFDRQANGAWVQSQKLLGSDTNAGDVFGHEVALRGDIAIVGAPNKEPLGGFGQGAAYAFERQANGTWLQKTKLLASDGVAGDELGWSVALSPSGQRAAVGAIRAFNSITQQPGAGAVYLFQRQLDGTWTQSGKLLAPDGASQDSFGFRVALRDDVVIASASGDDAGHGSAYVFTIGGGFVQKLTPTGGSSTDQFGWDLSIDGGRLAVGADGYTGTAQFQGAVYVFSEDLGGHWSQDQKLVASSAHPSDFFGLSVAIQGDRLVAGAPGYDSPDGFGNVGQAFLFHRQPNGTWTEADHFVSPDSTGSAGFANAVAISGDRIACGGPGQNVESTFTFTQAGSAYVYRDAGPGQFTYGTGKPGCNGTQEMTAGAAEIGSTIFRFRNTNEPSDSTNGLLLIADVADLAGSDPFGLGVKIHLNLFASTTFVSLNAASDPGGTANTFVAIPNVPGFVGATLCAQTLWLWQGGCFPLPTPSGLSSSRGVSFVILAP